VPEPASAIPALLKGGGLFKEIKTTLRRPLRVSATSRSAAIVLIPWPISILRRAVHVGPSPEFPHFVSPRTKSTMARLTSALRASVVYGLLAASAAEVVSPRATPPVYGRAPHVDPTVSDPNPATVTAVSECHLHGATQYVLLSQNSVDTS